MTKNQAAIPYLFNGRATTGNLRSLPKIFPDQVMLRHDSRAVSEETGKREDFWNDLEAYQTSFAAKRPNVETNRSNAHTIKQRSYLAGRQGWQCYPGHWVGRGAS